MYPLMKIVAPMLGVRFMNLGYWPSTSEDDRKLIKFMDDADDLEEYVLNVEAAHLYSDFRKFVKEVSRVLRSGGTFCYVDVRYPHDAYLVNEIAESFGFILQHFEDCTEEVVEGLNYSARKYDDLLERAPFFVQLFKKSLRETYCAPGTDGYERLKSGQKMYVAASWMKN
ncbi:hypothetical protein GCK72_013399 [Caenorhabditis remanei]|uniref:Methyltransferase type 11 domain-containing protein n=1 Tax=Caenorhabditis remanei TaxID=31234 RepID=A0A6A5GQN7_CAERE|nr:hypothetical protein GCK72_013399 [Caenorhabditis remanei]KAF1756944.1 hypothetical protein GCK72_013399 [Caenorhabditis remanei]